MSLPAFNPTNQASLDGDRRFTRNDELGDTKQGLAASGNSVRRMTMTVRRHNPRSVGSLGHVVGRGGTKKEAGYASKIADRSGMLDRVAGKVLRGSKLQRMRCRIR